MIFFLLRSQLFCNMRNHSRQNTRIFHRESGIPRTLTSQKPLGLCVKESQIRVGKYKYDPKDELGRGFSGNVYKAVEIVKQHKRYAIKVVNLKKFKGSSLDMLEEEIAIHTDLEHEHIVKLHEVVKTAHNYYLIMEYCPHGNLSEYIAQKKQLTESNALEILAQLNSAYRYLIEEGVIHRDIKPANILRVGNRWKLSDFGFATKARFGFKDRVSVGTPLYMAPESLRRNFYSFKSDLYAIGIVLFEMIAGHTPHEAHTERELLEKISNEIPLPSGVKHPKLAEFFLRISVVSDAKRMNRDEFENFDFGSSTEGTLPLSHSNSNSSFLSTKGLSTKGISNDELSTNRFQSSCADLNSKLTSKSGSKVHWLQSASSSKHLQPSQPPPKPVQKNPMLLNSDILSIEFQFVHHNYFLLQNIDSLLCDQDSKNMLMLILFKLLLKTMRLLCDKNLNHLSLNNWKEYQQCKLYQQLYSELTGCSEKYEKDYLEFIRYNDIRVIRAVNRKFPELCTNNPLSGRFHETFREFLGTVIRKHDDEVSNLIQQGEQDISDRFEALNSLYSVYKLTEIRSNSPKSTLLGEKPTLLENYSESKLTRSDYSNLKRRVKHICP